MKTTFLHMLAIAALLALATTGRGDDEKWWHRWFGDPAQSPHQVAQDEKLLVAHKAEAAVPVLLEFVAHAPDDAVGEEVLDAVYALGVSKGKLHPAVTAALDDPAPGRRAVAAVLLGRFGDAAQRQAVVALLEDK